MKKISSLLNTASRYKKALYWIMLGSLLLAAAACAEGGYGYQTYPAPSPYYPSYRYSPGYYDYYGPTYPYDDPEYWRQWQDRQGGG